MMLSLANTLVSARASGGGFVGPLDAYTTNLAGVWSAARRLLTSYTGSLIRVRRSSDNAEMDIDALASGALDVASMLTFCGAGNGFIRMRYDQLGANNIGQSSAAAQEQIVSSGSLVALVGQPFPAYAGAQYSGTAAPTLAQPSTIVMSIQQTLGGGFGIFLDTSATGFSYMAVTGANQWNYYSGANVIGSASDTDPHVARWLSNGASSKLVIDKSTVCSGDGGTTALTGLRLGSANNSTGYLTGCIGEVVAYSADVGDTVGDAVSDILATLYSL
jgi:hypothetical protein